MTFSRMLNQEGRAFLLAALVGVICFSGSRAVAQTQGGLQKDDLVAICGDSITEQKLYSLFMEEYLLMCQPQPGLQTVQFGWSGERAVGFVARQKNDCLVFKPTVATTCYGMNDGGYVATEPQRLEEYKTSTIGVVKNFKEAGVRFIVVGAPGVVDSDTYKRPIPASVYNQTLADFGAAAKQVATEQGVAFADVHGIMMDVMAKAKAKYGKEYPFAGGDGVHPGRNGHLVMAYAFLKALGCKGDIGTITVDLKGDKATATEGHKVVSAAKGSVVVESSRYPFCFLGDPAQQTTRSIVEFLPFNEDLNRYLLVVKNAGAAKLKVTWGKDSKVFSAAELEKGINLAAEFLDNPFCEPFTKVEGIMANQQNYETHATKLMLHSLLEWRKSLPDMESSYAKMEQSILEKDKELRQTSRAAIAPVTHTIKIEPAA